MKTIHTLPHRGGRWRFLKAATGAPVRHEVQRKRHPFITLSAHDDSVVKDASNIGDGATI